MGVILIKKEGKTCVRRKRAVCGGREEWREDVNSEYIAPDWLGCC
jgi:hypothetical protein